MSTSSRLALAWLVTGALLTGAAPAARAADFASSSGVTIPAAGPGNPYPSAILVSGLVSSMNKVTVTVDLAHGCMFEVELLLVGPQGERVLLMADASDCTGAGNRSVFTFDDAAAKGLSCDGATDDPSGSYKPTDCEIPGDPREGPLPYPAPGEPYSSQLAVFNGTNPNGTWSLYVNDADQLGAGAGSVAGWRLSIDAARLPTAPAPGPGAGPLAGCAAGRTFLQLTDSNDVRSGTAGADFILAGAGDDSVSALGGDDCVDLGPGDDRGVGGPGDDRLAGVAGKDRISGSSGKDRIAGGRGGDRLLGGGSADRLGGDSGNDRLDGGSGGDSLKGGTGNDRMKGGRGRDRIAGGSGRDSVSARDRTRDRISCGRGRDKVVADRIDRVSSDCEKVRRR